MGGWVHFTDATALLTTSCTPPEPGHEWRGTRCVGYIEAELNTVCWKGKRWTLSQRAKHGLFAGAGARRVALNNHKNSRNKCAEFPHTPPPCPPLPMPTRCSAHLLQDRRLPAGVDGDGDGPDARAHRHARAQGARSVRKHTCDQGWICCSSFLPCPALLGTPLLAATPHPAAPLPTFTRVQCDLINMSFGEPTTTPNSGR